MRIKFMLFIFVVCATTYLFANRVALKEFYLDITKPELPEAVSYQDAGLEDFPPLQGGIKVGFEIDELEFSNGDGEGVRELQEDSSVTALETPPSSTLISGGIADPADSDPDVSLEPPVTSQPSATPEPESYPDSYNLAVPFTPQAPFSNWEMPYQEACEEASVYMVHKFYEGADEGLIEKLRADEDIKKIVEFENVLFGFYEDTTAEQIAMLVEQMYGYTRIQIIENPTVEQIKVQVASGRPVIVPAAGRMLKNPYFTGDGPLYHMLVIRGYTDTQFITNDPGTKHGEEYLYSFDRIMDAIHDWNDGDVENGKKVVIIIYPEL
ncbi:MAG: C39 family peptidase [Patescibacteria group bacterium]